MSLSWTPRVLTVPKARRSLRIGEEVEVHRSHQAVACRKRYAGDPGSPREPGKPRVAPAVGLARVRYTGIEAMKGKPRNGTRLEPKPLQENHEPGGRDVDKTDGYMPSGSLIRHSTLSVGKPRTLGKDAHGSTQPAKETCPGHCRIGPRQANLPAGNS